MVRKNRRRSSEFRELDLNRALGGTRRETRRGREWSVRTVGAAAAQKVYTCPSCGNQINVGESHVVVWQADNFFGDERAISDRRHWHQHCWRLY